MKFDAFAAVFLRVFCAVELKPSRNHIIDGVPPLFCDGLPLITLYLGCLGSYPCSPCRRSFYACILVSKWLHKLVMPNPPVLPAPHVVLNTVSVAR